MCMVIGEGVFWPEIGRVYSYCALGVWLLVEFCYKRLGVGIVTGE